MIFYSRRLKSFLDKWPGKRTFGMYRFLPAFFVLGAALEFSMINWSVGDVNFYNTYKKRQALNIVQERLEKVFSTMPAGVSWGQYLKFTASALLSMFAGSQIVHLYYKPLEDMDKYIAKVEEEYKIK